MFLVFFPLESCTNEMTKITNSIQSPIGKTNQRMGVHEPLNNQRWDHGATNIILYVLTMPCNFLVHVNLLSRPLKYWLFPLSDGLYQNCRDPQKIIASFDKNKKYWKKRMSIPIIHVPELVSVSLLLNIANEWSFLSDVFVSGKNKIFFLPTCTYP
jgi:hypothetical protein